MALNKKNKITIIGSGNLGTYFAYAFEKVGFQIEYVYGRNKKNATKICERLYASQATDELDFSKSQSSFFIICVKDDAILEVADELILPHGSILCHSSGMLEMEILSHLPFNCGVFYPLMTFTKGRNLSTKDFPFCLEAFNNQTLDVMKHIASHLSQSVYEVNSEERKLLHLTAVISNNFTNHLISLSKNILDDNDINYKILKPILEETISKAFDLGPVESQTGPAIRKDWNTIKKHIEFLKDYPKIATIYHHISNSIDENRII